MSADAIDTKSPWDWVYVWLAIRSDGVQTIRDYLQKEDSPRARKIKRALNDMRRAEWWGSVTRAAGQVTIGGYVWELWHGSIDIDHVHWLISNMPNTRSIRCWLPDGLELGQSRDSEGDVMGTPTYRELTTAQETTLKTAWATATGNAMPMWWPGRPCGMPVVAI